MRQYLVVVLAPLLLVSGCSKKAVPFDPNESLVEKMSGEKAFQHVAALVEFGPRPAGSESLEASRQYLEAELAELGWVTERQTFTAKTPEGEIEFVNLRARFDGVNFDEPIIGLLAGHYDTKYYESFDFVGANDGGSSTGLLVELARVLAERPDAARAIELVFFDGEEAFGPNITSNDGLYGSKHYSKEWLLKSEKIRPQWGVLIDMVGDKDLKIRAGVQIPGTSLKNLADSNESGYIIDIESVRGAINEMSRELLLAAEELDYQAEVGISPDYILDDHIPLNVSAGIPTIDLIDLDYPYWHTPGDTLDKVSAESLEITGKVTLRLLEKYLLP